MTTPRASRVTPEPEPADLDVLRAWWLANLGTALEVVLTPLLDDWLIRLRAGESVAQLTTDPGLRDADVLRLLALWELRDDARRAGLGGVN